MVVLTLCYNICVIYCDNLYDLLLFSVPGYKQIIMINETTGKHFLSCSHKFAVKIHIEMDTMECKQICDEDPSCNYFYTNDTKYCMIYEFCGDFVDTKKDTRTVLGRSGATFEKIKGIIIF